MARQSSPRSQLLAAVFLAAVAVIIVVMFWTMPATSDLASAKADTKKAEDTKTQVANDLKSVGSQNPATLQSQAKAAGALIPSGKDADGYTLDILAGLQTSAAASGVTVKDTSKLAPATLAENPDTLSSLAMRVTVVGNDDQVSAFLTSLNTNGFFVTATAADISGAGTAGANQAAPIATDGQGSYSLTLVFWWSSVSLG